MTGGRFPWDWEPADGKVTGFSGWGVSIDVECCAGGWSIPVEGWSIVREALCFPAVIVLLPRGLDTVADEDATLILGLCAKNSSFSFPFKSDRELTVSRYERFVHQGDLRRNMCV